MNRVVVLSLFAVVVIAVLAGLAYLVILRSPSSPTSSTTSIMINGTKYWEFNIAHANNLTTMQFAGVTFDFSYPCNHATPPPPTGGVGQGCANVTFVTIPCTTNGAQFCQGNLPKIQIVLPNGVSEYFNNATTINGKITYDSQKAPNHVYLIGNSQPEVGIEWVTNHAPPDSLLLLVSA